MDLYKEIISEALKNEEVHVTFPNLELNIPEIIEAKSYHLLQKIKAVIENDSLSDFECVEEIVCIFEEAGSCSGRHDFG